MAVVELEISKNWFTATTVQESNWDRIRNPLMEFADFTNRNLEQIANDAFGVSYSLDNDGSANLTTDLQTQINNILAGATPFTSLLIRDATTATATVQPFTVNWRSPSPLANDEIIFHYTMNSSTTNDAIQVRERYITTDVTHATRSSAFAISTMNSGVLAETFRVGQTGHIGIPATSRIFLDGTALTGNTYFSESAADIITATAGGTGALSIRAASIAIPALGRIYLDGIAATGDTYLTESAANLAELFVGGSARLSASTTLVYTSGAVSFAVPATQRVYFDGGGDTYLIESAANLAELFVGGSARLSASTTLVYTSGAVGFAVPATQPIYLDGGGDTYIYESAANLVELSVGGAARLSASTTLVYTSGAVSFAVPATQRVYFDGGGNTSIRESAADTLQIEVGGVDQITQTTTLTTFAQPLLLPAEDPPVANEANRNGIVKAWLNYTDNSGVVTNSYNIDSVTSDDGDGVYTVTWDTDFAGGAGTYAVFASYDDLTGDFAAEARTSNASSAVVRVFDMNPFALADGDFMVMAIGTQ